MNGQNNFYHQYTIDDGLPTNYVYGATQDTLGNIWVYTEDGICLFDGYTFKTFTTDDGLPHNDVFWMVTDKTGKMWVLTFSKTVAYINEKYEIIELDSLKKFKYSRIVDGKLILVSDTKVIQLWGDSIHREKRISEELKLKYAFQKDQNTLFTIDKSQNLKVSTGDYPVSTVEFNSSIHSDKVFGSTNAAGDFHFGGINSNLFFVSDESLKIPKTYWFKNYFDKPIHSFAISHLNNNKIVLGTNRGYLLLDNQYTPIETFIPPNICNQHDMLRYFEDKEGNIWLGSKNGGLFQIPYYAKETKILEIPTELNGQLFKLLETEEDIYTISERGDIYKIQKNKLQLIQQINVESDLLDATTIDDNNFCFGNEEAFYLYDIETATTKNILPKTKYNIDSNSLHTFSNKPFSKILVLNKEDVFFSEYNKLYKEVNNQLKLVDSILGTINTIIKLDSNNFLIGTRNKGVYLYNEKKENSKPINNLNHIRKFFLYNNQLFIACNEGVLVYEQKQGATQYENWQEVKRFDSNVGLPTFEVLDVVVKNDSVYALTKKGLVVFSIHSKHITEAEEPLQVNQICVNGDTLKQLNNLQLKHHQNNLTIAYNLQHYASNGLIKYAHHLEPIDKNWRNTKERKVHYAGLNPGTYRFRLKAKNFLGDDYQLTQAFDFTIEKPYWQKWWFIGLCMLVILGSIGWLVHFRRKQIKLKIESKEKELSLQIAELKMRNLRAQMNPHFIANVLGSIQYYILDHKTKEANKYLALFAHLMRKFLDSAVENTIMLKDELMLLKEYTELEKMRFGDKFDTQFEIDQNINQADEWLPSMLIQPFVENAINHGLEKRKNGGLLHIKFWKIKEDELICEICDNGIGVANSKKYKKEDDKSKAIKNVQDRLEIFKNAGLENVKMTIANLTDDIDYPGTKVKLKFINFNQYE